MRPGFNEVCMIRVRDWCPGLTLPRKRLPVWENPVPFGVIGFRTLQGQKTGRVGSLQSLSLCPIPVLTLVRPQRAQNRIKIRKTQESWVFGK